MKAAGQTARFGIFELDLRTLELRRHGRPHRLAFQPARVLAVLVTRAGELVTRDELAADLWGSETFVDFDAGLAADQHRAPGRIG